MSEKTPKQFRFEPPHGINKAVRTFTGDAKTPEEPKERAPLSDVDFDDINFGFPADELPAKPIKNVNPDKITDASFPLSSLPPIKPSDRSASEMSSKPEIPEIEFGSPKDEQTIETVVQDAAKKRTKLYPEALIKLLHRLKKEENK
jgi:hypothetical protein